MRMIKFQKMIDAIFPVEDEDDEDVSDDLDLSMSNAMMSTTYPPFTISTSAGTIPLDMADSLFNMFFAEANFDLRPYAISIGQLSGVEYVKMLSQYKIQISIGKMFDSERIFDRIRELACKNDVTKNEIINQLSTDKIVELAARYDNSYFWVCYVSPNGHVTMFADDKQSEELNEHFNLYDLTRSIIGGSVFVSWD